MKLRRLFLLSLIALFLLISHPAFAHIGSKDVFEETAAGPYKLYVTIRMPNVIPGIATVEVRSSGAPVSGINITPLPLVGEASKHPPAADAMKASSEDPAFFSGGIWMMASGSWQVRLEVDGAAGKHVTSVPVPAVAITMLKMDRRLGTVLGLLGLLLIAGMAGIVAAAVREARLKPGVVASGPVRRRAVTAMIASLIVMVLALWGGAKWWNVEAASFSDYVYRPLESKAVLSGDTLDLKISAFAPVNKFRGRSNDDFIPDHGHLMHLYAIREPGMDAVFHLHPTLVSAGDFRLDLPAMPPGDYTFYGDVVHANGFPETLVSSITIPAGLPAAPPGRDDAVGHAQPLSETLLGNTFRLPDGYTMVWDVTSDLTANTAQSFHFRLLDPDGKPPTDMQPYMGMAGHAAFIKTDGTVFAHVHPAGSAAMAAVMIANPAARDGMADMPEMTGMSHPPGVVSGPNINSVDFPYGFPTPGRYRILVQMKHGATVETGVFDAQVR